MKTIVEVTTEGLVSLMGQRVTLFCLNYIWTGKLTGVNDLCVKLEDAALVFDTGAFDQPKWLDAQKLPNAMYVMVSAIESFGILKE